MEGAAMVSRAAAMLRLRAGLRPISLLTGVRVVAWDDDHRCARVRLVERRWNGHIFRARYGGSLFAMTAPFWRLLLSRNLGPDYHVGDAAAEIEFLGPGARTLYADLGVTEERLAAIRSMTADGSTALVWFTADVVTGGGELVARVRTQLSVQHRTATGGRGIAAGGGPGGTAGDSADQGAA